MADLNGQPMLAYVVNALRHGAERVAVVEHPGAAAALGCIALHDPDIGVRGPLIGVLAALEWAAPEVAWLLTAPCDVPLLAPDFGARLIAAAREAHAPGAFARSQSGAHPLCAVWSTRLAEALRARLEMGVHPPVREFAPECISVSFENDGAFANVNTPEEFARISEMLSRS